MLYHQIIKPKNKLLSTIFYDYKKKIPMDKIEYGLENIKILSYDRNRDTMRIQIGTKEYECDSLNRIVTSHYNKENKIYYFKDRKTNQYYFVKNNDVKGPFKEIITSDTFEEYVVIDRENKMYVIGDKKENQGMSLNYLGYQFYKKMKLGDSELQLVKGDNGKYALASKGYTFTDFVFDTPNIMIQQLQDYISEDKNLVYDYSGGKPSIRLLSPMVVINGGKLHIFGNGSHACEENFGSTITEKYINDEYTTILKSEKATIIYTYGAQEKGKIKVQLRVNRPYVNICGCNEGAITLNFEDEKGIKAIYYNRYQNKENYEYEYIINKIPYEVKSLEDGRYCIVKNNDRQYGIIDNEGNTIVDFGVYDNIGKGINERYIPIHQNGKWGVYDLQTRKIAIEPFCLGINASKANQGYGYVGNGLMRFEFLDHSALPGGNDVLIGIVNTKGHIVLEPTSKAIVHSSNDDKKYKFMVGESDEMYINLGDTYLFKNNYVPEEAIPYIHLDTCDIPEENRDRDMPLMEPLTVEEYLKKTQEKITRPKR